METSQLAFAGDPLESNAKELSKFGGSASFPSAPGSFPPSSLARCGACGRSDMWNLVCQFEAPMTGAEGRCMFVFGCNSGACSGKDGSVRALRCQKRPTADRKGPAASNRDVSTPKPDEEGQAHDAAVPDLSAKEFSKPEVPVKVAPAEFGVPAFGGQDSDDEEGGFGSKPLTAFGKASATGLEDDLDALLSLREQKQKQASAAGKQRPSYAQAAGTASANGAAKQDHKVFGASVASVLPTEEAVEDTAVAEQAWSTLPSLPCFALDWDYDYASEENRPKDAPQAMDLAEASAADLDLPDVDGKLGPEEYEKAVYPKGMSKIFRTFQKVVERAPEQALRYEGEPTFFSEPVAPASVPRCPRCGGKRAYEFQVMPSVLTTLRMMDHTSISADSKPEGKGKGKGKQAPVNPRGIDAGMDFGTVLVYTCESSCQGRGDGSEGWSWFDEVCVVQVERE